MAKLKFIDKMVIITECRVTHKLTGRMDNPYNLLLDTERYVVWEEEESKILQEEKDNEQ